MKLHKRNILFLLLFIFSFFTLHDYVLENADNDTQYELAYSQNGIESLDLASQMHEHLHIIFAFVFTTFILPLLFGNIKPEFTPKKPRAFTSLVPQRPPLF